MADDHVFYADLFTTFVEDGSTNSWRWISGYDLEAQTATVVDIESDPEASYEMSPAVMRKGLELILADEPGDLLADTYIERFRMALEDLDAGMIDAYDADAIGQAGMMGEVVYG